MSPQVDKKAFRDFERTRHDDLAISYNDFFAPITALAIPPILDAVQVTAGKKLLDIACGSGVLAGAAVGRGAVVDGVDLAPNMVTLARTLFPQAKFQVADAEELPFNADHFDCVVCNFGLGHFPSAEHAVRECIRVLRPGGYLAVSWWDLPSRQRIQGLFVDALEEVGVSPPASVPVGPPMFRYSDDADLQLLLKQAGLALVTIQPYSHTYKVDSIETLWAGSMGSLARTSALILAQSPEIQEQIRTAYDRLASAYSHIGGLAIPISFKVARGERPR